MANEELYATHGPQRVTAGSGLRTARPTADAATQQMQALKAEIAAKAAAEAKLQADLRASLRDEVKPKGGILSRILGR
ncbi:hypothetical protein [Neogemmobacter tilapiae]|uniref:Uncharacterized protein n=1 Tax=Neogemmobacter tilapiae TaxID=875041 RepID=A0A918TWU7_9RHOB|nr:hypothetical protein [Gemmobacter tilapiae]GHC66748.1 hypothetical protein GCM10007315_34560 [Gemmobacter tilapiae]